MERFGIRDVSVVQFVSDRGSNFVKALKNYSSYNCFVHRLNNVLVLCFYQKETVKAQTGSSSESKNAADSSPPDVLDSSIIEDIDEELFLDASKIDIKNVPNCAREVLRVLNNCKEIVKYVKLVSGEKEEVLIHLVGI